MNIFTRNNFPQHLEFMGLNKKIDLCSGPLLGNYRGMDTNCCIYCENIKHCIYNSDHSATDNVHMDDFIHDCQENIEEIKLFNCFSISSCIDDVKIYAYKQNSEVSLSYINYAEFIFKQLKILSQRGFIIKKFDKTNFTLSSCGFPVFIPNFDDPEYTERVTYNEDRGVEIKNIEEGKHKKILFRVTNREKVILSKWNYLAIFYEIIDFLSKKERYVHEINKTKYHIVPDFHDDDVVLSEKSYNFPKELLSPQKITGKPDDKYVVLDLDSTLIYSISCQYNKGDYVKDGLFCMKLPSTKQYFKVFIRNHANKFLKDLVNAGLKLIIWSAGTSDYVKYIVSELFRDIEFVYVFNRDHTSGKDRYKNLAIISDYIENFDLNGCRLIDDNVLHKENQEKNFIYIKPYVCSSLDRKDDNMLENFSEAVIKSYC